MLAHLPDPTSLIAAWCAQLAPGGRFVTVETERIDTEVETFVLYEQTARSLVADRGADLQVGVVIRDTPALPGTTAIHSELAVVQPSTAKVARLFGMNLATWKHDPFVSQEVSARTIDRITRGLDELAQSDKTDELSFCNRQVVYERD